MICKSHNAISKTLGQLNKIIKEKIWGTPRNIEDEEKWVQKREELAKEIKENRVYRKYNTIFKMTYFKFVKKIRKYAVFSFLIPLIAINLCLILYISLGNMKVVFWPNLNYNKVEYAFNEYSLISSDYRNFTFTNCPKYRPINYFITNLYYQ